MVLNYPVIFLYQQHKAHGKDNTSIKYEMPKDFLTSFGPRHKSQCRPLWHKSVFKCMVASGKETGLEMKRGFRIITQYNDSWNGIIRSLFIVAAVMTKETEAAFSLVKAWRYLSLLAEVKYPLHSSPVGKFCVCDGALLHGRSVPSCILLVYLFLYKGLL